MKLFLQILAFGLLVFSAQAQQLEAYLSHAMFKSPKSGPYAELYLSVLGSSVKYKALNTGGFQGKINVTYIFKQDSIIKAFEKYELKSPVINDTVGGFINFIDQQRIPLENGTYDFDIIISDANTNSRAVEVSQPITVDFSENEVNVADIEFVEDYMPAERQGPLVKSGIMVIPNISDFYPEYVKTLKFYTEIYHTEKVLGQDEPFLVQYFVAREGKSNAYNGISKFQRYNTDQVNVLLSEFDISRVPTGNYELVVQVKSKTNELLSERRTFWQRVNESVQFEEEELASIDLTNTFAEGFQSRDTLVQYVRSLRPISNSGEAAFIDNNWRTANLLTMQQFFYRFWIARSSDFPQREWEKYAEKVKLVNREFSTINKMGYETDRGEKYLQYGAPNTIVKRDNEPSNYPYHIWHYYSHPKRTDARYIFYNPDLVTNEYTLLHSNVRGEINNHRWQLELQRRNNPFGTTDQESPANSFGSEAEQFFNMPR